MNNKKIIIPIILAVLCLVFTIFALNINNNNEIGQPNPTKLTKPINEQNNQNKSTEGTDLKLNIHQNIKTDFANDKLNIPYRIILTAGEDPSKEVNISWNEDVKIKKSVLLIGKSIGENVFTKDYERYDITGKLNTTVKNGKVQEYNSFSLRLKGLLPDTKYVYCIGDGNDWSEPTTFKTLADDTNQTIGFFGDEQGYKQSQYDDFRKTYEAALETSGGLNISLLAGDIVDDAPLFEQWMFLQNSMYDYLSSSIWAATPGNHDMKDKGVMFSTTFLGPVNGLSELENMNYYFECGNAIIACIDTESPSLFEQQKTWLNEIMNTTDKTFKIVFMHRSVYPMKYNELNIRKFAQTFDECGIDLVLSGHDHIYNRTTMCADKKVDINEGVTYVVGGSSSGSKYYHETDIPGGRYWENVVFDDDEPVFSIIKLEQDKLNFCAYAIKDGKVHEIDSFVLTK